MQTVHTAVMRSAHGKPSLDMSFFPDWQGSSIVFEVIKTISSLFIESKEKDFE